MISVLHRVAPDRLPHPNPLFARYAGLDAAATRFFSHRPDALDRAVATRSAASYPRTEVSAALVRYGHRLGAS